MFSWLLWLRPFAAAAEAACVRGTDRVRVRVRVRARVRARVRVRVRVRVRARRTEAKGPHHAE